MSDELINKYRPQSFEDVIGQDPIVRALQNALAKKLSQQFLFMGAPGLGKTTLARIVAKEAGCRPEDLMEIDGASNSDKEHMKEVLDELLYRPLGEGAIKAVIVDEFQALSKAAVQTLLKTLEEPPSWVWWLLCTTEPTKVPVAMKQRCVTCDLKPVKERELIELVSSIAKEEKIKVPSDILELCVVWADGSPRQAISNLVVCAAAKTWEEAEELLQATKEAPEAFELARLLAHFAPWKDIQVKLRQMKEGGVGAESARHVIRAYMTTMVLSAKKEELAGRYLEVLDAFSQPFNPQDQISPLVLACGKAMLS